MLTVDAAMNRAAVFRHQRIRWLHMAASRRAVPDCLIEDDRGAERIGQAGDGVGQIDAAIALVGDALARGVDDDAGRGQVVGLRPRPEVGIADRLAGMQMAVEISQLAGHGRTERLRHAEPVAGRRPAVTLHELVGSG